MKFKKLKKGLLIGMSAVMVASAVTPSVAQAATWKQNRTGWWWEEDNGSYPVSEWKTIGGKRYYFDQSGYMKSGWYKEGSDWYYLGAANDGAMKTGWQKVNGAWYYLNADGKMATGWKTLGANKYYLENSGAMHTGWLYEGSNWYYLGGAEDGAMKTGWQKVNGTWYYMYDNGKMAANTWIGDWYVDGSGAWTKTKEPAKWIKSGNRWWYRHGDGGYTTNGFENINGQTYYFDAAGWMVTGWKNINNQWYYFDASGAMKTNAWIGDYYVGADGVMATDAWIGEWYVDASGKWIPGKVKEPVKEPDKEPEKEPDKEPEKEPDKEPEKEEIALKSISLDETSVEMWTGEELTLQVTCDPENTTVDKTVKWSSSDTAVATVENGKVKAVGKGTATITAEVAGKKATCEVSILPDFYIWSYEYEQQGCVPFGLEQIDNMGGIGFILLSEDSYYEFEDVEWSISDETIAELIPSEKWIDQVSINGIKEGTTTLTATYRGKTVSFDITTKKVSELESLSYSQETYTKKVGEKFTLFPDAYPENAYLVGTPYCTSSNTAVATVDAMGVIRTKKEGTTTITASYGGPGNQITTTCKLKVEGKADNNELEKIEYEPENWDAIPVGEVRKLNIVVYPATYQYKESDIKLNIIWSGTDPSTSVDGGIAEIKDGNIIALSDGLVTIEASLEGCEPRNFTLRICKPR